MLRESCRIVCTVATKMPTLTVSLLLVSSFVSTFVGISDAFTLVQPLVTVRSKFLLKSDVNDKSLILRTTSSTQLLSSGVRSNDYQPQVVCIGEALFDCIATDEGRGLSVNEIVQHELWDAYPGGAVANVATASCKLGTEAAFIGCIGSDSWGDEIRKLFQIVGVNTQLLQQSTLYPTRLVMVTRSVSGDRSFGSFWNNLPSGSFADCYINRMELWENPNTEIMISNAQWIVCGTLGLAFPETADCIRSILDHPSVQNGTVQVLVDVNWRPVFWDTTIHPNEADVRRTILSFCQKYATILKLTDEEAEWMLGSSVSASDALRYPERIHEQYFPNALAVLVTAGEKGAAYSMLDCSGYIEPMIDPTRVVETTGAGDAFSAGFLHQILELSKSSMEDNSRIGNIKELLQSMPIQGREVDIENIVRFASAAGALTCTKPGAIAAQPTLHELNTFLSIEAKTKTQY